MRHLDKNAHQKKYCVVPQQLRDDDDDTTQII